MDLARQKHAPRRWFWSRHRELDFPDPPDFMLKADGALPTAEAWVYAGIATSDRAGGHGRFI